MGQNDSADFKYIPAMSEIPTLYCFNARMSVEIEWKAIFFYKFHPFFQLFIVFYVLFYGVMIMTPMMLTRLVSDWPTTATRWRLWRSPRRTTTSSTVRDRRRRSRRWCRAGAQSRRRALYATGKLQCKLMKTLINYHWVIDLRKILSRVANDSRPGRGENSM